MEVYISQVYTSSLNCLTKVDYIPANIVQHHIKKDGNCYMQLSILKKWCLQLNSHHPCFYTIYGFHCLIRATSLKNSFLCSLTSKISDLQGPPPAAERCLLLVSPELSGTRLSLSYHPGSDQTHRTPDQPPYQRGRCHKPYTRVWKSLKCARIIAGRLNLEQKRE